MSKIVKVEFQGDIRRLPKDAPTWPFSALLSSVRSTYGLAGATTVTSSSSNDVLTSDSVPFLLKYVDPEGDEVTLASDEDYVEAVQVTASLPSLRLKVYLKSPAAAVSAVAPAGAAAAPAGAAAAPAGAAAAPVAAAAALAAPPTPTLSFAGSLFRPGATTTNTSEVLTAAPSVTDSATPLNRSTGSSWPSTSAASSSASSSASPSVPPPSSTSAPTSTSSTAGTGGGTGTGIGTGSASDPSSSSSSSFDEAAATSQLRDAALAWLRQHETQIVAELQTWLANPTIRAELVQAALALLDQVSSRVLDVQAMIASVKVALPSLRTNALVVSLEQLLTTHRAVLSHYLALVQPMLVFVDSAVFTNLRAPLASRLTEKLASVRAEQVAPAVRRAIDRLQARVDRAQGRGGHCPRRGGGGHPHHGHGHGHGFGGFFGGGHGGGLFGGFGHSPLRMLPHLLSWIRDLGAPSCGSGPCSSGPCSSGPCSSGPCGGASSGSCGAAGGHPCSSSSSSTSSSSSPSSSSSNSTSSTNSASSTTAGNGNGTGNSTTATSGIFSSNSDEVPNIHYHVQCDGCGMRPLVGFRYKCTHCVNYDLCASCEAKGEHDSSHPFIKIHASSRVHAPWMGRNMMPPPWAPHAHRRPYTLDPFGPTDPFSDLHAPFGHPHPHHHPHHHGPFGGHGPHHHGHPHHGHPHHGHPHHGHPHHDAHPAAADAGAVADAVSTLTSSPALNAAIVEHVSVLEGATLEAGATVIKTWRVLNTGSRAWPANIRLIFERGDRALSAEEEFTVVAAAPGQTVEVSAVLTAPSQQSGRFAAYFRLADDDRMPFGPQFAALVDVVSEAGLTAPSSSSSSLSSSSSSSSSSSGQPQPPQQQTPAFNSRFPSQHQALREMMFFDDARNERVLELAEGELDRAVALLLDQ